MTNPGHDEQRDGLQANAFYQMLTSAGEMGMLIRNKDWSETPLGSIDTWSQSLQTAVSICLFSRYPMFIWWGHDYIKIYNDAYRPILAHKHPQALGLPGHEIWGEIWHIIGPMADTVYHEGKATWSSDQMLPMYRYGFTEETYFTFSYSPIFDETGSVGGIFTACTETTQQVLSQRRLRTLHDLGEQVSDDKTVEAACYSAAAVLMNAQADVPFALIYLLDENGHSAHLVCSSAVADGSDMLIPVIDMTEERETRWSLAELQTTEALVINNLSTRFQQIPPGIWDETPHTALILPIMGSGLHRQAGFLIVGVSPRLTLDEDYRHFFELITGHIATAIATARAYEEERKRAEALAELDLAKTEFFSNVSHEFRTPLTLMLNPLRELLESSANLETLQQENLEVAHRNSLRLLKLVNTLLDFSRIQSNRIRAAFQPTDLTELTTDLASNFRSAVESAGLKFVIDAPPLSEPAYVDRDMWEKIVLNLLSNAFKFTFTGEIAVSLRQTEEHFELKIRDTGIGIAESDLPYIFERFHRVRDARSRSYEGSGIGLALVAQLVQFHRGSIEVISEVGQGTTFTVSIPIGSSHLPQDQIGVENTLDSTAIGAAVYTEEALRWLDDETREIDEAEIQDGVSKYDTSALPMPVLPIDETVTILIVDDNLDMREYLRRLLGQRYHVEAVSDGMEALKLIERQPPNLVIADVMMPKMDGFALLSHLRSKPQTRAIPIILLSARAGEETRIEGLQAGADDYLIKPFSARELLARVEGQLQLAQLRRETQATIENIIETISDPFYVLDNGWRFIYANQSAQQMLHKSREELIGTNVAEIFRQGIGDQIYELMQDAIEKQRPTVFESFSDFLQRWVEINIYPGSEGIAIYFRNIHERKVAEEAAQQTQLELDTEQQRIVDIFESITDGFVAVDRDFRYTYLNPRAAAINLELTGQPPEYFMGRTIWEAIPTIQDSPFGEMFRRVMAEGTPGQLEGYFEPVNRWFSMRAYPSKDGLSVYFADITEQQQTRTALTEAEKRLALAQEAGNVGIWDWNGITNETYWTATTWRLYGLEPRLTATTDEIWSSTLHPDDLPRVRAKIDRLLASTETNYRDEFRIMHTDGMVRWIESIARIERNVQMQPVRMTGVNLDITRRKYAESALRNAEERLRLMIDSAKDYAIFALDEDGYVTNWNSGAERLFGYPELEIIGEHFRILYTREDRDAQVHRKELEKAAEVGYAEDERWHVREDGSRFYASGMVRPIRNENGVLQGFTKIARDMTTQKLAQQRTQVLQNLAIRLAAQSTLTDMAETVIRAVHDAVGESSVSVFLLAADGQSLERVTIDPLSEPFQPIAYTIPVDSSFPIADAIRTKSTIWIDSMAELQERYPQSYQQISANNIHATFTTPLWLNSEETMGVFSVMFRYPKQLSQEEQDLLVALAHLCAQAFWRAQLFEAEQQAKYSAALRADRLGKLQMVTATLLPLLEFDEIARLITDVAVTTLEASTGVFSWLEDENTLRVVYTVGSKMPETERKNWIRFPVDSGLPSGDVIRRGQPIWLENTEAAQRLYPNMKNVSKFYPGAWMMLPLFIEGKVVGGLGFAFTESRIFNQEERDFMMALAQQCSQALERNQLYEAEKQARQNAEEANTLKNEYLDRIGEELRNTIASINTFAATLLSSDVNAEKEQQVLRIINDETDRLTQLIEQLRNLAPQPDSEDSYDRD